MFVKHRIPIKADSRKNKLSNFTFNTGSSYDIGGTVGRISSYRIANDWTIIKANENDKLYVHIIDDEKDNNFYSQIVIPPGIYPTISNLIDAINTVFSTNSYNVFNNHGHIRGVHDYKSELFLIPTRSRGAYGFQPIIRTSILPFTVNILTDAQLWLRNFPYHDSVNQMLGNFNDIATEFGSATIDTIQLYYPKVHYHHDLSIEIKNLKTKGSVGCGGELHFSEPIPVTSNYGSYMVPLQSSSWILLDVADDNHFIDHFDIQLIDTHTRKPVDIKSDWSFVLEFAEK